MKPCKRIEIVIEQPLVRRVEACLEEIGVPGFTLISPASGRGGRGRRRADGPDNASTNAVFIVACDDEDVVQRLVEAVRPILARYGGLCLLSDAEWVRH